jgi:hypothetical protein
LTSSSTRSGIPTAKGFLPPGTSREDCINHNRACKVAVIVIKALEMGYDADLTDDEIDLVADAASVRPAGGEETRDAVRAGLLEALTDDDSSQYFAEAAMRAASSGHPFRYTDHQGRTVLMVPIPVGE